MLWKGGKEKGIQIARGKGRKERNDEEKIAGDASIQSTKEGETGEKKKSTECKRNGKRSGQKKKQNRLNREKKKKIEVENENKKKVQALLNLWLWDSGRTWAPLHPYYLPNYRKFFEVILS